MKGAFCEAAAPCQDILSFSAQDSTRSCHNTCFPERGPLSILFALSYGRILPVGALWIAIDGWRHMSIGSRRATSPFPALIRHYIVNPLKASCN
jgi:hypothetical protein